MAVNDLTFEDVSTVLNSIVQQATGQNDLAVVDSSSFVTVAQTALKMGYDTLNTAISQVLSRTIFSVRAYTEKFASMQVDNVVYGNIVRKINYIDMPFEKDEKFDLQNGQSVDMWKVNKPSAIQTNFYGGNTFYRSLTRYGSQLDMAFRGPEELAMFWSGLLTNIASQNKQANESMRRACLANLIGGVISANNVNQQVHLLTEYNAKTGGEYTAQTIYQPDNFAPFMRWVYARIETLRNMLEERTSLYHLNPTSATPVSGVIMRHTPRANQRIYLLSSIQNEISANTLATTYHNELVTEQGVELVNFWQSPKPGEYGKINVTPSYMDTDGTVKTGEAVEKDNIFGVIFDYEAAGTTIINTRFGATPYNIKGDYFNYGWGWTTRWWNDFTENAVILMLD